LNGRKLKNWTQNKQKTNNGIQYQKEARTEDLKSMK